MSSNKARRTSDVWVTQDELDVVLRELRRRRKVTQKQVAGEADVSPAAIARIEKGDRRPSQSMLSRLAPVFGTTAEEILDAAERVAAGEQVGTVLDDLPTLASAPAAAPAEMAGGDGPRTATSRPAAAPPPPAGPRLQVLALAEQLESLDDRDAAIALLRDAIVWLTGAGGTTAATDRLRRELHDLLNGPQQGREPVAAMTSGEVRYVFAHAIGADEHGHLWIDPLTRARTAGYDAEDPRVERYDDGRIVLDTGRLEKQSFGPRDPARHRVRATNSNPDEDKRQPERATADLEEVYARTVIEIHWPDRPTQIVEPGPEGTTDSELPADIQRIHVITAFNPRSRLLRRSENEERNRLLRDDLDRAGLDVVEAIGRSPDDSWTEDCFAVIDADPTEILDLANRYEQSAVYEWTPAGLTVSWTDPERP